MSEEKSPFPILVVDDDEALRRALERVLHQAGFPVSAVGNATEAVNALRQKAYPLVVSDVVLPDLDGIALLKELKFIQPDVEVILVTAYGTVANAVEAMRLGAQDYITKPFSHTDFLARVRRTREQIELRRENRALRQQLNEQHASRILIGSSPAMREIRKLIRQVAPSCAPVLVTGDSGTGKEMVAEAIHAEGPRARGPLIKVSCAALPESLLEAELFGYERGAFTGAVGRKEGRFDLANGGTLFLDEIAEAPPSVQLKLLRVLQDGKYERLGGKETLYSDVHIISATNRNLEEALKEKTFREDLYYRLNVIPIHLPPLRERKDEILELAMHFLRRYAAKNRKQVLQFSPAALNCLLAYEWPGNVRELENVVERAVILTEGETIEPNALPATLNPARFETCAASDDLRPLISLTFPVGTRLEEIEDRTIQAVLEHTRGNRFAAARLLQINPRTICRHLGPKQQPPFTHTGSAGSSNQ
jgi:two-component system response regulator HydG